MWSQAPHIIAETMTICWRVGCWTAIESMMLNLQCTWSVCSLAATLHRTRPAPRVSRRLAASSARKSSRVAAALTRPARVSSRAPAITGGVFTTVRRKKEKKGEGRGEEEKKRRKRGFLEGSPAIRCALGEQDRSKQDRVRARTDRDLGDFGRLSPQFGDAHPHQPRAAQRDFVPAF